METIQKRNVLNSNKWTDHYDAKPKQRVLHSENHTSHEYEWLPESWLRPAIAETPPANQSDLILPRTTDDHLRLSGIADEAEDIITATQHSIPLSVITFK